jgi:hypothetical protein
MASPRTRLYAWVFVTALATLMLEITLARILSVVSWFYVSYSAISIAVLGMTAGSLRVFFTPAEERTPERTLQRLARSSVAFGWAAPALLVAVCVVPVVLETQQRSIAPFVALVVLTAGCALPFFFSGVIVTTILGSPELAVGRAYASDLIGSATACLLVVLGLSFVDPFSLVLLTGAIAMLPVLVFHSRRAALGIAVLCAAAVWNHALGNRIQPIVVKDHVEDRSTFASERWNSLSRVTLFEPYTGDPWIWGASPKLPRDLARETVPMKIDGVAFTAATRFHSDEDLAHLKYDVSNIGYALPRKGLACIIGIGGGRDLQSALHFGYPSVIGIDVNPIFVDLLEHEHKDFAGLAGRPGVTMVVDEARSYLARHDLQCTMIQMSLIDTYAATSAGAFTLSENALYTLEAWELFYARLAPGGVYSVSRWNLQNDLSETSRLASLAVTTLLESGVKDPARHLMLIGGGDVGTLLLSRDAFSEADVAAVTRAAAELQFDVVFAPGVAPAAPLFQKILGATSRRDLEARLSDERVNLTAPTDENPYFFNILKFGQLNGVNEFRGSLVRGCLKATSFLFELIGALMLLFVATIIAPLALKDGSAIRARLNDPGFVAGVGYFALIGFGFMVLEMGLIQKLNLYLGHPIYSLSVALFTLILSAGAGSALSERLGTASKAVPLLVPLFIAVGIESLRVGLQTVLRTSMDLATLAKIPLVIGLTFPVGIMLGLCLPYGLRLSNANARGETPWLWAVNGVAGVLGSSIALLLSIYAGVSVNFHVAALCYVALGLAASVLRAKRSP